MRNSISMCLQKVPQPVVHIWNFILRDHSTTLLQVTVLYCTDGLSKQGSLICLVRLIGYWFRHVFMLLSKHCYVQGLQGLMFML